MRNPNGYGSVVKLPNAEHRRKPYWVRKTIGYNEKKQPIYLTIAYCATREEGNIVLAEYNKSPYDVDKAKITFSKLYDLWLEKKSSKLGESNLKSLKSAYKHCKCLYKEKYKEIKAYHMQDCIDNCKRGHSTQALIKNLFWHIDRFALEMDISSNRFSDLLTVESAPESKKIPFSEDEINKIWELYECGFEWADSVLLLLYTGFRISEMLSLKTSNVDLVSGTMMGGTKTTSGKNPIVPIHPCIFKIVQARALQDNDNLFGKLSINGYYKYWNSIMNTLNLKHTPHECRHTFRTMMDNAGANKRCIDLIMGHKSKDVGERVYTHKTIQQLKEAIELIIK